MGTQQKPATTPFTLTIRGLLATYRRRHGCGHIPCHGHHHCIADLHAQLTAKAANR